MRTTIGARGPGNRAKTDNNDPGDVRADPARPRPLVRQPQPAEPTTDPTGPTSRDGRLPTRLTTRIIGRMSRVGWQRLRGLRGGFRLPDRHTPVPRPGRLIGVCGWAAALGLLGLAVAARASIAITLGNAPGWFEPTVVTTGLVGIGLTIAAFTALHRRRLPWLLLTAATGPLALNLWLALTL